MINLQICIEKKNFLTYRKIEISILYIIFYIIIYLYLFNIIFVLHFNYNLIS